jgi:hypothetical protein
MTLSKFKRIAAISVSAAALVMAGYSGSSHAVVYELNSDIPLTIHVSATVAESVDVTTSNMHLGHIGVFQDESVGGNSVATLLMDPDNTIHDTPLENRASRLISKAATGQAAASVDVTGAFPGAMVYEHFENFVDLICSVGTCLSVNTPQGTKDQDATHIKYGTYNGHTGANYVAPQFKLLGLHDSISAWVAGDVHGADGGGFTQQQGVYDQVTPANNKDGEGITDNTGELKWHIGAKIGTEPGSTYYASGTYSGSFDIILSY